MCFKWINIFTHPISNTLWCPFLIHTFEMSCLDILEKCNMQTSYLKVQDFCTTQNFLIFTATRLPLCNRVGEVNASWVSVSWNTGGESVRNCDDCLIKIQDWDRFLQGRDGEPIKSFLRCAEERTTSVHPICNFENDIYKFHLLNPG